MSPMYEATPAPGSMCMLGKGTSYYEITLTYPRCRNHPRRIGNQGNWKKT